MFWWHIYSDRVISPGGQIVFKKLTLCHLRMVKLLPSDFVLRFFTLFGDMTIKSLKGTNLYNECQRLDLEQYCLCFASDSITTRLKIYIKLGIQG